MVDKESLLDPEENEERYVTEEDYDNKKQTRRELSAKWGDRIQGADINYKMWADRFKVSLLNEYYEGYQWFFETDENNRPYVINMFQATIENKLPSLLYANPQFGLRARPTGLTFDEDEANRRATIKEDALNFVCSRPEFGITDKHELAVLDAFLGFGIMEVDYSDDPIMNLDIPIEGPKDPLDALYCKQIPFDTFRCSASANWDLSVGKWFGYYEFIPYDRLGKYARRLKMVQRSYSDSTPVTLYDSSGGKIQVGQPMSSQVIGPPDTCKIWKIWDFNNHKRYLYAPDDAYDGEHILDAEEFEYSPLSFLRFGKRRKGWYPYPPVWNWLSPQDEINDARQAQRLHRKRFSRKYLVNNTKFDDVGEIDKLLYGPDGTFAVCNNVEGAIKPVEDAPMDPVSMQSLMLDYNDFNRVAGSSDETTGIAQSSNRTTAKQAGIIDRRAQIREAKDSVTVGNFMCSIGRCVLRALRKAKKPFWIKAKLNNEGLVSEIKPKTYQWKQVPADAMRDDDYDVDLTVTSVSPISAQQDKTAFMEFLAVISQYEILAFSPALLREAAYRVGYKNEAVLNQFQQMAQLAAIGRLQQLKGVVEMGAAPASPAPGPDGSLAQNQVDASTPPDNMEIMNQIFNRQGVQ